MDLKKLELYVFAVVMFILISNTIYCDVLISEVLYDPPGPDAGKEWVELYNPEAVDIILENYSIESGDGSNENDWTLEWTGKSSDMIKAYGFFLIGEKDVNGSDIIVNLDLQNGPDAVRLKHGDNISDLLGWGNHTYEEYFEAHPAADVSGKSLERKPGSIDRYMGNYQDSNNNYNDFLVNDDPSPQNSLSPAENYNEDPESISLLVEVVSDVLNITSISVTDENLHKEGIQVYPLAGRSKDVNISAVVECSHDIEAKAVFFGENISLTRSGSERSVFTGRISINFSQNPGSADLTVYAKSSESEDKVNRSIPIEIMSLNAIDLDSEYLDFGKTDTSTVVEVFGDKDMLTKDKASIRNIGNTVLDVAVFSKGLFFGNISVPPENINYSFDMFVQDSKSVSDDEPYHIGIKPSETLPLSFRMWIPDISSGVYSGKAMIRAVPK